MLNALRTSIQALGYSAFFYPSGKKFIESGPTGSPSVVLIDVQMPEMTGLELQSYLRALPNPPAIILISGQSNPKQIIHGMKAGAVDFLLKPFSIEELDASIRIASEKAIIEHEQYKNNFDLKERYSNLTPREQQVFCALGQGILVKNIASEFGVSISVIKLHKSRVMKKLNLKNLQELASAFEKIGKSITSTNSIKIPT